jgi:putative acyl-CoA dehydrogenase
LAARLYREMPLNAIWEGSGNVMALDVVRVLQREGAAVDGVLDELEALANGDKVLGSAIQRVRDLLGDPRNLDTNARTLLEALALSAAAVLLRAHAPSAVADAFIASRLRGGFRQTYGAGLGGADTRKILGRVLPA